MRVVAMRVTSASVAVDGTVVGAIDEPGLLLLAGVTHSDTDATAHAMARKIAGLRILAGERSCAQTGAPVLVVSQFTLYGSTGKGRRPSWSAAAPGDIAAPIIETLITSLRDTGIPVQTGVFGAKMAVTSVNDGPFTILLEL